MTISHQINPFGKPILSSLSTLTQIGWKFPYIANLISVVITLVIVAILALLFISIGIATQISGMFVSLMAQASKDAREADAIEKSGYVVSIGIYFLLFLPFWLIQLPFQLIGWFWSMANPTTTVNKPSFD